MTKYLISFGGTEVGKNRHNLLGIKRDYTREVQRLFSTADRSGYDLNCISYDNNWLLQSKYKDLEVLKYPSFAWSFKPISIYETFQIMNDGDYLLWIDSNDILISNPQELFDLSKINHVYLHDHYPAFYPNEMFTTSRMFKNMECDDEKYHTCPQIQVNILAVYKDDISAKFVNDWLKYATDCDTIIKNDLPNSSDFVESRHEQSIASILREKYNIPCSVGYPYYIASEKDGIDINS